MQDARDDLTTPNGVVAGGVILSAAACFIQSFYALAVSKMRSLRVIYAIAFVLATTVFLILTAQLVRQIFPSDRHALEKLSHGLAVLAMATVVVGFSQVLYTRRTHFDQRFSVVWMILITGYLLIAWALGP